MKARTFRAATHLTLPRSLKAGPGATDIKLAPGDVVEIDSERCIAEARFIAKRLRFGDLVEVTPTTKGKA